MLMEGACRMSAFQVLSFFVLFIFSVTGHVSPVCFVKPSKYSKQPKLPSLPEAFTATVEANIVNKKYSIEVTEFYDKKSNVGALRHTGNGKTTYQIWDYSNDEVIMINENALSCRVSSISSLGRRMGFGPCLPTGNGSCEHIEGVADLFRFGAKYNETYMGEKLIRGIRCNHWRTCINHNHTSFTLDYYFSVSKWNSTFGYPETVVRSEINGTGTNHMRGPRGRFSYTNETHDFYHVYDFFSFIPGPPKPKSFQIPRGLYCKGMKNTKQQPKVPYKVFSMELEVTFGPRSNSTNSGTVFHLKEMYDSRRNLVQLEMDPRVRTQNGSTTTIYDFNTDIIYSINRKTQMCNIFMMSDHRYFWQMLGYNDSHHIRLKNTMDLFFRQDKTKTLIYSGSANVRGIDADVWVEKFNGSWIGRNNRTYKFVEVREVYFSKSSWNLKSWSLPSQHQVPVRFDMFFESPNCSLPGRHCHWIMNVFNFNSNPQLPIGAFDIRQCFKPEQRKAVHFALIGDYKKYAQRDRLPILYAVRDTITTTANVSHIRISSVEIYHVDDEEQLIGIKLYLLEKPNVAGVSFAAPEKSLKDAVLAVKNAVENGKLSINFLSGADSNVTQSLTAKRSSYYEGTGDVKFTPGPGRKKSRGVPAGAVVAIALVMLVVGLLFGLGVAQWQAKRKGISLFAYQRQDK